MPKMKLTHKALGALTVDRRTDFWDVGAKGFGVRVTPDGTKTFTYLYYHRGKKKRLSLGRFPETGLADARRLFEAAKGELAQGYDPATERDRTRKAGTFAELAEGYLERYSKRRKRSWKTDERMLRKDLLPAWGQAKASEISRADVRELLDAIVERGAPIQANRTRGLIGSIYNWGIEQELVEHNPTYRVKLPARERRRERVLSWDEIRELWEALDSEEPVIAAVLRLMLLTAQRKIEVVSMKWRYIQDGRWTIPAEVVKGNRTHVVPLSRQAQYLVNRCRGLGREWVMPSPYRSGEEVPLRDKAPDHRVRRMRARRGWERFTPHDLRRTAATGMAELGARRTVVSRVLNHSDHSVTAIYERYSYLPEMEAALQAWGDEVERQLGISLSDGAAESWESHDEEEQAGGAEATQSLETAAG